MTLLEVATLAAWYLTLSVLTVYSVHRLYLVRLNRISWSAADPAAAGESPALHPSLAVQLPVYNEPNVVARLIDAVAQLEYPGVLSVQVLDDSTDETSSIAAARVAFWRERGVRIDHIRRDHRAGFKAGALAHGMSVSDAELFAVFDADFVPSPDFLLRTVPHFADARVGMVQTRWDHLNRNTSMLTRVQAIFLDAHFAVESAARHRSGRFFNFNGTAGVWRRRAIEDAGGWSSSTLTEDLDLSYRAQLAGWKFVFRSDVLAPAELPAALSGFQEQQYRWAKGSIQTARKLLPRIVRSGKPANVRVEALFHLTNNVAYVLSVILALLIVPALAIRTGYGISPMLALDALLFIISTGSLMLFLVEGQRRAGRRVKLREMFATMPLGVGMAVRNSAAVITGAFENGGYFARTPKRGDAARDTYEKLPRLAMAETVLALYFLGAIIVFAASALWPALPFLALFFSGYFYVAFEAFRERFVALRLH